MTLREALAAAPAEPCHPWPRHVVAAELWVALPQDPALRLLALWADTVQVHALLLDDDSGTVLPVSTPVQDGGYPALSPTWPGAAWFERMVQDLWGHAGTGAVDLRPWLDHGHWPHTRPLAPRPGPPITTPEPPELLAPEQDGLMQLPCGPVPNGIGEAAHLRLTLRGDTVLRAEARLGYAHKGTLMLMRAKSPRAAARYVARLAAEATVAHALAFAHAAEAATEASPPPRAIALRAVMAELERITGHLDELALLAETLGAGALAALCATHREWLHRAASIAFGHRLMMDCVVPGGIAADIVPSGAEAIGDARRQLADVLPALAELTEAAADRLAGLGVVRRETASRLAVGGIVGRSAGRRFDARIAYPPYAALDLVVPTRSGGDAAARCRQRIAEIAESLRLLAAILDALPDGAISMALPQVSGEGIGCAELQRGDIWHWLRLDHGQIAAAFVRDPGWALWPLAETVLAGGRVDEMELVRRSLGLPGSGMDL